jgi:predicted transcriptional regulator
MTKRTRLILTSDGERAFGRLADSIARVLEEILRKEKIKKKDLAKKAGVDQAVLSRALDGSRNIEIRTVGALLGSLGYVLDVAPKRIRADATTASNQMRPEIELKYRDGVQTLKRRNYSGKPEIESETAEYA